MDVRRALRGNFKKEVKMIDITNKIGALQCLSYLERV